MFIFTDAGGCSLLMVKHLYFAFHICEIKLLLFLHLYTSAGGFCDHLLDSSNLDIDGVVAEMKKIIEGAQR